MTAAVPNDPAMPQLAYALDTERMLDVFRGQLFAGLDAERFEIRDCRLERVKYKPGRSCLICYRVEVNDRVLGESSPQLLSGRLYATGSTVDRYMRARQRALLTPKFGPALAHIAELDMIVWAFPNERKLERLDLLVDAESLRTTTLPVLVAERFGDAIEIADVSSHLVHYVPEHTCSVRLEAALDDRRKGARHNWVVYGKTYYDDSGRETASIMRQLWQSGSAAGPRLKTARLLHYDERTRTLWQEALPGRPLSALELRRDAGNLLQRTGSMIGALHQSPVDTGRRIAMPAVVADLDAKIQLLGDSQPHLRADLEKVGAALLDTAALLPTGPTATLHGDLHLGNVLAHDGETALIDLDASSRGDPLLDVGSLIAAMLSRALLEGVPVDHVEPQVRAILDGYARATAWALPPRALRWHTATALLRERAFRSLTRLKSGRLDVAHRIVALATQIEARGLGWLDAACSA